MHFDAIILAGGAGKRLGGVDKGALSIDGRTLLDRVIDAVSGARRVVVVGEPPTTAGDARITVVRERPAGGGPAAAIGAGVATLQGSAAVVVLACDMPGIAAALPPLLDGLASMPEADGVLARDGDRIQYLAGVHRLAALRAAVEGRGTLHGTSVRELMGALDLRVVDVPAGSTSDIDTWDDATAAGASVEPSADA